MATYLFKIIIIGDSGVGKSNIIRRYATNSFDLEMKSTIGIEFMTKEYNINSNNDNFKIMAQIWDTAGQERYKALINAYYRGAVGIIVVYDITNRKSFNNLKSLLEKAIDIVGPDVKIIVVGNKIDLQFLRAVSTDEGKHFANEFNTLFTEVSALDNTNIAFAFEFLINSIFTQAQANKILQEDNTLNIRHSIERNIGREVVKITVDNNDSKCC